MIRRILWKELLNNLKSLRLSLTFILLVISMMVAGLVFAQKYHQMIEDYSRDVNVNMQRTRERAKTLNSLAFHSFYLYKSPNPMRLCAEGREKDTPNSFEINVSKIDGMQNRTRVNFLRARLEDIDWAFIIGVIVSFAAIILTYDGISGEREDGTLKLMLSNSVSRASIILGKYLGGLISLLIPLAIALILNLIIVLILGVNFTAGQWGKIGVISLISLIYVSCFLMLGLFISSITKNSTTSLVLLLFLWTIFIAIIPSSGRIVAGKIQKLKPREFGEKIANVWEQVASRYPSDTFNWNWDYKPPVPEQIIRRGKCTWEIAEVQDRIRDDYRKELLSQLKLAQNLMRASPMMTYTFLCEVVAGTGSSRSESFMSQVKKFRDEWREWILSEDKKDKDSFHIVSNEQWTRPFSQKELDFEHLPRFSEKLPGLKDSLQSGLFDLLLLILFNVALFMASYLVFMRYDVR